MSRIAEGEPRRRSLVSLPTLALAAGVVIVLLVGSVVFYNMRQTALPENTVVQTPVAAPIQQTASSAQQPAVPQPTANTEMVAQNDLGSAQRSTKPDRQTPRQSSTTANANNGGSFTIGQRQARPLLPEGIDPRSRRTNVNTSEIISPDAIPVQDILLTLGMSAEYKNGWLVKSVTKNTSAERSGVKAGDLVDAIGDSPISADTDFHGAGRFSTITVRRDGKPLVLKLK
jgi:C-terminal processing protease CtpA/Prc